VVVAALLVVVWPAGIWLVNLFEFIRKRALGRPKRKLEGNIKMDIQGMGWRPALH